MLRKTGSNTRYIKIIQQKNTDALKFKNNMNFMDDSKMKIRDDHDWNRCACFLMHISPIITPE